MSVRTRVVRTRVLESFDDPMLREGAWKRLLRNGVDTLYLTRPFLQTWWETLGYGDLLLVAAERDGELVALAPLYQDDGEVAFLASSKADHLDFVGDVSDPTILDALLETAIERTPGFVSFRFERITGASATGAQLEDAAARLGLDFWIRTEELGAAVDLRDPARVRRSLTRKKLRNHENFFRRRGTLSVAHLKNDAALPYVDDFFEQHIGRWGATPRSSGFTLPEHREFYRHLLERFAGAGWLWYSRLECSGRAIAAHYGFSYGGCFYWDKSVFAADAARHSPGTILLKHLILAALDSGLSEFDLGRGSDAYQLRFATDFRSIHGYGLAA